MKLIKFLMILSFIPMAVYAADFIPSSIAVGETRGEAGIYSALLRDRLEASLRGYTNLTVVFRNSLTNFTDTYEPLKFIGFNRIHGLVIPELKRTDAGWTVRARAYFRDGTFREFEVPSPPDGLLAASDELAAQVAAVYPMLERRVVELEEQRYVSVGRFEVIRPRLEFGIYDGLASTETSLRHDDGNITNYVDTNHVFYRNNFLVNFDFKYRWIGLFASFEWSTKYNYWGFRGGLHFNLLKGILTLSPVLSTGTYDYSCFTNGLMADITTVGFELEVNINHVLSYRMGLNPICLAYELNNQGLPGMWNGVFSLNDTVELSCYDGLLIGTKFRIGPRLTVELLYTAAIVFIGKQEGEAGTAGSYYESVDLKRYRIMAGVSYRFDIGG